MSARMSRRVRARFAPLPRQLEEFHAKRRSEVYPLVPRYADLRDRLLSIGGLEVVFPGVHVDEEEAIQRQHRDVEIVLERGETFPGDHAHLEALEANRCHHNVATLHEQGRGAIGMGWSLGTDGLWREHSWIFGPDSREGITEIIETTAVPVLYHGARLNADETARFVSAELD
jgi:hypothetical protein